MSDGGALFRVWSDAQARVKAQMQELSIAKNNSGGYKYNAAVTLIKQINRVLEKQLFEESADGMVGRQQNSEHAHQLQVQRHHQEELPQETVYRQGAGGEFNNQHRI